MSGLNIDLLAKQLGSMSAGERRNAVEQLQALVRETSFELAREAIERKVECCPRCGGMNVIRKGKSSRDFTQRYFCHDCGRSFGTKTNNAIGMSKLDSSVWMAYIECFVDALPLRTCAERCHIALSTAFSMRHRILEVIERFCDGFSVAAGRTAEIDETYFAESFKGNHTRSKVFTMPRKPHKRGHSVRIRGLSSEQICVLSGVNDKDETFFELAGRGYLGQKRALDVLKGKVKDGSIIATDQAKAYPSVLKELGVAVHECYDSRNRTQGVINRMNTVHSKLKYFMTRFRGVATKHLSAYLVWFRWRETYGYARINDTSNTVARQMGEGTYQRTHRELFNRPALYMEYWESRAA